MSAFYMTDSALDAGVHRGFIEHDELTLTDDELRRLKGRAMRAVSMDDAPATRPEPPTEYSQFLDGGGRPGGFDDFLAGRQR
ncbi:hypothetical protein [Spiribacter vilamensis]|uniref:Uncharacterized protein n=1 Tax=Spiribacter vilamensis TaxID=531306 RepID=A0A4Q8D0L6_9GAMM|nr:hypothetical protein [Spiribacter vilamensis]RZU98777.1 hypothetical protein EV698_1039 [Spiribacter vilamensis]TVO62202.1 hypothetical protein FPL09_09015 [Spiribacter vilamensis]